MRSLTHLFVLFLASAVLDSTALATDILTNRGDNARTGLNSTETILTPANVASSVFGLLYNSAVDGQVYAQPLYVSAQRVISNGQTIVANVLYVATEHDSLYAFNADTGVQLWKTSLLPVGESPVQSADPNIDCDDLVPELGITATPVIDRGAGPNGTIFVLAFSTTGDLDPTHYYHRLYAIDLSTGQDRPGLPPALITAGPVSGSGPANTFVATEERGRAGLLLLNGIIYTTWGSYCDNEPYTGWIISYDENNLSRVAVLNTDPNGTPINSSTGSSGNGIWQAGNGPAVDASGNIYVSTGNGPFDPTSSDYGDSVLKLSPRSLLSIADYFTPSNQQTEANQDIDLGSGGPMVFDITGTDHIVHHLAVAAGKDWNLYVLNRDNLGQFNASSNNSQIYQQLTSVLTGGVWSSPAYFKDANGNVSVYYGGGSENGTLYPLWQFQFDFTTNPSQPTLKSPAAHTTTNLFGFPGATPTVSSNGTSNGIVWAYENRSGLAVLHAYDATNVATELFNSSNLNIGARVKFVPPTVCNGKVFVGTSTSIAAFGLPASQRVAKDFNGDGSADLVLENSVTGHRMVWLLRDGVHFSSFALPTIAPAWHIAGVGDFLGTGQSDLVFENTISGRHKIWLLQNGALQSEILLPATRGLRVVGAGDFNGDGKADLVLEKPSTGRRLIWMLNGGVYWYSVALPTIGPSWHIAGVGDFLGNGQSDLVLENTDTGRRELWILKNGVLNYSINLGTLPPFWHIGGAADFDGDGQADLVFENEFTGRRMIWILKNGVHTSTFFVSPINTNWHIVNH